MPEYSLIPEQVTTLCLDLLLKAMALNVLLPKVWVHCAGSSETGFCEWHDQRKNGPERLESRSEIACD